MVVHHQVTVNIGVVSGVKATGEIIVRTAAELPPALRQHEKPVVIEDAELARRFQRLLEWREARSWLIAVVGGGLIAYAISMNYKVEIGFEKDFKLQKLNGKITLTPK
jgi:hypothetical protein